MFNQVFQATFAFDAVYTTQWCYKKKNQITLFRLEYSCRCCNFYALNDFYLCSSFQAAKKRQFERKMDCYKLRAVIEGRRNRLERHKTFQSIEMDDARERVKTFHFTFENCRRSFSVPFQSMTHTKDDPIEFQRPGWFLVMCMCIWCE